MSETKKGVQEISGPDADEFSHLEPEIARSIIIALGKADEYGHGEPAFARLPNNTETRTNSTSLTTQAGRTALSQAVFQIPLF
jgi:hypothetical protein